MPYFLCKKLNVEPKPCNMQIFQLDQLKVKVLGGLKDVRIKLVSKPSIHQVIDIIVVDIPESCVILLSRDWYSKVNSYFDTNCSHMLLPQNE